MPAGASEDHEMMATRGPRRAETHVSRLGRDHVEEVRRILWAPGKGGTGPARGRGLASGHIVRASQAVPFQGSVANTSASVSPLPRRRYL